MSDSTSEALLDIAGRAATAGRYATATALLAGLEACEASSGATLLRARIAAQQGRFDEAVARFREVLLAEPGNRQARSGLERVRALKRGPAGRLRLRANGLLLAACALGLPLVLWALGGARGAAPAPGRLPALPIAAAAVPEPGPVAVAPDDGLDASRGYPAVPVLESPGVVTRRQDDQLVVVFERGLFASGTVEPTAEAAPTLRALGRALGALPGPLAVVVEGHTDDVPLAAGSAFRDNQELGLARAVAVISFLSREARLPLSRFSARGLGVERAPYAFVEPAGGARNRTVVLWIETSQETESGAGSRNPASPSR